MASTNGSQSSFLTPAHSASSTGVRVFDVGESLDLSADERAKLSDVLARIIEVFPADPPETEASDDTAH